MLHTHILLWNFNLSETRENSIQWTSKLVVHHSALTSLWSILFPLHPQPLPHPAPWIILKQILDRLFYLKYFIKYPLKGKLFHFLNITQSHHYTPPKTKSLIIQFFPWLAGYYIYILSLYAWINSQARSTNWVNFWRTLLIYKLIISPSCTFKNFGSFVLQSFPQSGFCWLNLGYLTCSSDPCKLVLRYWGLIRLRLFIFSEGREIKTLHIMLCRSIKKYITLVLSFCKIGGQGWSLCIPLIHEFAKMIIF